MVFALVLQIVGAIHFTPYTLFRVSKKKKNNNINYESFWREKRERKEVILLN